MKIKLSDDVSIDLDKLIESRLLVQANSGGGKSWAIRRLIEQSFGKKQIIVIDPEGEFGNMRSEFDFVYAGKGGDAPVESRSAALLAHRLLELKASAIIDLYELPPQERKHFVRLFCEALVNAPKELWHDLIVIIDEAHVFAPEKGESEALGSVIDLASRGRKRGYCAVLATQRPAKLNKDAAAECNNKLIGRASLDIDRKRASEELGFSSREQVLSLRDLEPGEFYCFGPAISRDVERTTIGDVRVKPAKRGVAKAGIPAPSATVKKILGRLSDLPQEAAKEATTVAELKAELNLLKRQKIVDSSAKPTKIEGPMGVSQWMQYGAKYGYDKFFEGKITAAYKKYADSILRALGTVQLAAKGADVLIGKEPVGFTTENKEVYNQEKGGLQSKLVPVSARKGTYAEVSKAGREMVESSKDVPFEGITGPEQRILDAIALSESIGINEPEQTAVAFLAGYTYGGGGFNNPRGALKTKGLVEYRGPKIALTEAGRAFAHTPEAPLTQEEMHRKVLSILPGPEQKLLGPLLQAYPEAMSNEDLAVASGYTNGSGGFNNPKGRLRTLGLIEYPSPGFSKAKDLLFP